MYPPLHATTVTVRGLAACLCGLSRPGHFEGVATVVAKLLLQSGADAAVFGEKDYQQLLVIRRMVEDLCIPVRILGAPTLREADGLAMSSRNAYLSTPERAAAPELYRALQSAAERLRAGAAAEEVLEEARRRLLAAGFASIDYLELRASETLSALQASKPGARLFAAAYLGRTRLIDNVLVEL